MRMSPRHTLAGAIVTATTLAVSTQIAQADQFYAVQDPPEIEIGTVVELDNTQDPLVSTATETFTGFKPGKQGGTPAATDRPIFEVPVTVTTNADLQTITVVSLCLFQDDPTSIVSDVGNASDSDLATRCGFAQGGTLLNDDGPGSVSPADTMAITYFGGDVDGDGTPTDVSSADATVTVDLNGDGTVDDAVYGVKMEDATAHTHLAYAPEVVTDTGTPGAYTKEVKFRFQLSHAMANSADDWYLRAIAVTQPPDYDNSGTSVDVAAQWVQSVQADGIETSTGDISTTAGYDMLYYGALTTTRTAQDFQTVVPEQAKTIAPITTPDYLANDTSDITIEATAFEATRDSVTDTLELADAADDAPTSGNVKVRFVCVETSAYDESSNGNEEPTAPGATELDLRLDNGDGTWQIPATGAPQVDVITGTNQSLLEDVVASNGTVGSEEAAQTPAEHQCTLDYQGGAAYGNEVYSNTVTMGIYDAADTDFTGNYFDGVTP